VKIQYAVLIATGLNDLADGREPNEECATVWCNFIEAKADVIDRTNALLDYLVETDRAYNLQVRSDDRQFEVVFEYGPAASGTVLPFRMTLRVSPHPLTQGRSYPLDQGRGVDRFGSHCTNGIAAGARGHERSTGDAVGDPNHRRACRT
jgi:hypothetical protein